MFQDDQCLKHYLDGLSEGSRKDYRRLLERFFGFAGVSPVEAVEWQRAHPLDYRFVDSLYEWVKSRDLTVSSMKCQVGVGRGFFLGNRAPLPRDRPRFRSNKEPVPGELRVDEFKKILSSCNLMYRAAFLVQFQSGSGVGELLYVNEHHAKHVFDEVQRGRRIIRLLFPGRKSMRNQRAYYSFVGSDAVDCLRQYFRGQGWKRDTVLFRTQYGGPLTSSALQGYFIRRAKKLGLVKEKTPPCLACGGETVRKKHRTKIYYLCTSCGVRKPSSAYPLDRTRHGGIRYRIRTHELRDLFRTQWHRAQRYAGADGVQAEFHMGHGVDPLKYDKIMREVKEAEAEYRKAMPFLNVVSEDPTKMDRVGVEGELENMRQRISDLEKVIRKESEMALPEIFAETRA